jgi:hypothetical protein
MAKQFNMTTNQAAAMSIELTKLTGDVASFYNITDQAAATKLKAIFTGETEGLKELGVVMTQTQLDSYAMAKGWGKTTKEMTEQEKVILRYSYTMEKLGHAQGDFARTSDGYANTVRTLKLELENLKVEVGKELIPVAAMGIQAISRGLQAIAPVITGIATNIRLYAQAWQNASERTRAFAKIALVSIGVMLVLPKVIAIISKAVELLTVKALTLTTALQGVLGVIGIIFAIAAYRELSEQVDELRKNEESFGESAEVTTDAVDDLTDSLSDLSDSTEGLNTFLASFDEVNKVGGNSSLMSTLVTPADIDNILNAASGVEDLQSDLNSLTVPDMNKGFFLAEWWEEKKKLVKGFIDTWGTAEFIENWKLGAKNLRDAFDNLLKDLFPKVHQELTNIGAEIFDLLNPNADTDNSEWLGGNGETFTFTSSVTGKQQTALKYNSNGTATDLYKKYGMNSAQNKSVSNTTVSSQSSGPIDVTLLLDGRKIANVVTDLQNQKARSSCNTALVGG